MPCSDDSGMLGGGGGGGGGMSAPPQPRPYRKVMDHDVRRPRKLGLREL